MSHPGGYRWQFRAAEARGGCIVLREENGSAHIDDKVCSFFRSVAHPEIISFGEIELHIYTIEALGPTFVQVALQSRIEIALVHLPDKR